VEVAREAGRPARKTFAIGFLTGHEMNWLPRAMQVLRDELKNIQVTVTSDYSPNLAEALVRGRLDVAFLRVESNFDLCYDGGPRAADRPHHRLRRQPALDQPFEGGRLHHRSWWRTQSGRTGLRRAAVDLGHAASRVYVK
jgi:DNA-binding transcriptional LysR family regulator